MKKGVLFLFLFLFVIGSLFLVVAQEGESGNFIEDSVESSEDIGDTGEDDGEVDGDLDEDSSSVEETEIGDGEIGDSDVGSEGDESGVIKELEEEYEGEEIEIGGAGITPDSPFYFIDEFFDGFGDELKNKEEKVSEIREMIEKGKIKAARKALRKYREYADKLEKEIDPAKREKARRSAIAIRRALEEIESEISEDDKGEFIDDVFDKEEGIVKSVEIASKIKDLCNQLSELDPLEYSRVCRFGEDVPKWQEKLDKDLTKEQKKEANEFGEIMSQCFRTSGEDCRCEDISFVAMSEMCLTARPLAVACDIENDEESCDRLDSLEFPEMPDYLEDVLFKLEEKYSDDNFDHHIPGPCRDAGINGRGKGDREKCFAIMVDVEAPPECRVALKEAKVTNERKAREICEKIMFEKNRPQECEGLTDFRECGRVMFKNNAPQECFDSGLTGEHKDDFKRCEEITGEGDFGRDRGRDHGPPGARCMNIKNPDDRLICFEESVGGGNFRDDFDRDYRDKYRDDFDKDYEHYNEDRRSFDDRFKETKAQERRCAEDCSRKGGAWDFSGGECTCRIDDFDRRKDDRPFEDYEESECKDGCSDECPGASRTDCVDEGRRCECYYDDEDYDYDGDEDFRSDEGDFNDEDVGGIIGGSDSEDESGSSSNSGFDGKDSGGGDSGSSDEGDFGGSDSGSSGGGDSGDSGGDSGSSGGGGDSGDLGGSENGDSGGDSGITGNAFVDYYFR